MYEAGGEQHASFIKTDITLTQGSCLGQFTEHDQFRQRGNSAAAPRALTVTDRFEQFRT
ncbi:MAG TPA: hypothetical protein VHY19_04560 [Steroidobacteraceae bacterium]|nr:hypothetical protein [Steroidobacteraceae bacterium]